MVHVRRWGIIAFAVAWSTGILWAAATLSASWIISLGCSLFLLMAGIGIVSIIRHRFFIQVFFLLASIAFCAGIARIVITETQTASPLNHLSTGTVLSLQGRVATDPDVRSDGTLITVNVTALLDAHTGKWRQVPGTVAFFWPLTADQNVVYGDQISINGQITHPYSMANPASAIRMKVKTLTITAQDQGIFFLGKITALRQAIAARIQMILPAPEAALLIGILLGLKTPYLRDHIAAFTTTGTIHIVVTSGLKVTFMGGMILALVRRASPPVRLCVGISCILGYVLLSGAGPAAWRAGIMGIIALIAQVKYRDYDLYNALALAVIIMTGIDPLLFWDAGFQLSVIGTLGIAILAPRLMHIMVRIPKMTILPLAVSESLSTTIAAQIATIPILVSTFGIVSWIAPLANLVIVPFLPLFLGFGVLAAIGNVFPALGTIIGAVIWLPLHLAMSIIQISAQLPGAWLPVSLPIDWTIPLWSIGIGSIPLWWKIHKKHAAGHAHPVILLRAAQWSLVIGLLFLVGIGSGYVAHRDNIQVSFLQVGPGGPATLITSQQGPTILIDGGDAGTALLDAVSAILPATQHTIDLIIVTNTRDGHIKGLLPLATAFTIHAVATPGVLHPTISYAMWHNSWQKMGIHFLPLAQGDKMQIMTGMVLYVLWGNSSLVDGAGQQDINSLIFDVQTPLGYFLFLGDADTLALQGIIPLLPSGQYRAIQIGDYIPDDIAQTVISAIVAKTMPQTIVVAPSARIGTKKRQQTTAFFVHDLLRQSTIWQTQSQGTLSIAASE